MPNAFRSFIPRRLALLGTLAIAGTLVACSPDRSVGPVRDASQPSSIEGARDAALLGLLPPSLSKTHPKGDKGPKDKSSLQWSKPIKRSIVRTFHLTNAGGTFDMPETGLTLIVPANALSGPSLTITATALKGKAVAYSFEPHGTVFLRPLVFSQSLSKTNYASSSFALLLGGGYFANDAQVNPYTGVVSVDEQLPAVVHSQNVLFHIHHFSGYMVSMD